MCSETGRQEAEEAHPRLPRIAHQERVPEN